MRVALSLKNSLIFVHRWLGVGLCLLFLLWFISGIGMMYWSYPRVSATDRLEHLPVLDVSHVKLSVLDAYGHVPFKRQPDQVTLSMHNGRPAYRFRIGRQQTIVYADDGQKLDAVSAEQAVHIVAQWTGVSTNQAAFDTIRVEDQWTVSGEFRALRPLYKFTWLAGDEIYVSSVTGEVVQQTTRALRLGAYFGAIPHWLYFTSLRKDGALWGKVVIWSSGVSTVAAFIGLIVGIWMYSPFRRYRHEGRPSSIPYHGQKRLHTIFGLFFGLLACSWAFSGMLSMDPFPVDDSDRKLASKVQSDLRGRVSMFALSMVTAGDVVSRLPSTFNLKELEFSAFAGNPVFLARNARESRVVTLGGEVTSEFDQSTIVKETSESIEPYRIEELRTVTEYEAYYLDRHQRRPLPVIFVRFNDPAGTMLYIDPKSARVVQSYGPGTRLNRWFYHGLHSLDLPWLYRHRPAWDLLVLMLLLGGTILCVTSVVLAWRVTTRTSRKIRWPFPIHATLRRSEAKLIRQK